MDSAWVSIGFTILGSAATAGTAWGVVTTKLSGMRESLKDMETRLNQAIKDSEARSEKRIEKAEAAHEKSQETLNAAQASITAAAARISDFAQLKTSVVTEQVFQARMTPQDNALRELKGDIAEIRLALQGKVSTATMQAIAGELPPPRGRLPSRTDR